jgi:hypothetical protein
MRLPNPEQAHVELSKLTEYVLNPSHPRGRNKARVFASALKIGRAEAPVLRDWLLEIAINSDDAVETLPMSTAADSKFAPKCTTLIALLAL